MKRLFYALVVAGVFVSVISSCKKSKNSAVTPPPAGALIVRNNVHIVDSTQWILHGSIGNGIYNFTFTPSTPNVNVNVGDIIVGVTNGGYISKVTNVAVTSSSLVLTTQPATMADVFLSGQFTLQVPLNDGNQPGAGVLSTLSNFGLYLGANGFGVGLNGRLFIEPTINLTFAFDSAAGLTNFQMSSNNTTFSDSLLVTILGQEQYNWSKDSIFATFNYNSIQWVTAYNNIEVPVVMNFALSFIAHGIGGSANYGAINANSHVTWLSSGTFSGGLQYTANHWQPIYGCNTTNVVTLADSANNADINSNVSVLTQISSTFYRIAGPQLTFGIGGNDYGTDRYAPGFSSSTTLWNVQSDVQLQLAIFGPNLPAFSQSWTSDTVFYQTPYKLFLISGNNQTGQIAITLPQPLVVKVNDSKGNPVGGITVYFTITSGGGYIGQVGVNEVEVITDQTGTAQLSTWTMGAQQGTQTLTARVQNGNQVDIGGSPVTFTATAQ